MAKRIRAVLLDLSGTLHVGDQALEGALEAVQKLQGANVKIRYLTNTSKTSSKELLTQLQSMGFTLHNNELVTSVLATRNYLQRNNLLSPFCFMEDLHDFAGIVHTDPPHDCVVVGLAPSQFTYENMNKAFRILLQSEKSKAPLIAVHRANYLRDTDGGLSLGPGPFVTALESATDVQAKVIGKPNREFFESAAFDDIPLSETCMVGDDAIQDIQGAIDAGVGTTILVQTGKYRAGDEDKVTAGPSATCKSIVDAVEFVLNYVE